MKKGVFSSSLLALLIMSALLLVSWSFAIPIFEAPDETAHWHRFEFNNAYRELLSKAGMAYSGLSPEGNLVEISELRDHPFMVGSQFHPEFKSRPERPHPLFREFVRAARMKREGL